MPACRVCRLPPCMVRVPPPPNGAAPCLLCALAPLMHGRLYRTVPQSLRMKYVGLIYTDRLADEAKATYWATYFAKDSTDARNGGAHVDYLAAFLRVSRAGPGRAAPHACTHGCVGGWGTWRPLCAWGQGGQRGGARAWRYDTMRCGAGPCFNTYSHTALQGSSRAWATWRAHLCCCLWLPEALHCVSARSGAQLSALSSQASSRATHPLILLAAGGCVAPQKNGGKFVAGSKLSVGDLCLFDIIDLHARIFPEQLKETVSAACCGGGCGINCARLRTRMPGACPCLRVAVWLGHGHGHGAVGSTARSMQQARGCSWCSTLWRAVTCCGAPPSALPSGPAVPRADGVPRCRERGRRRQGVLGLAAAPAQDQRQRAGLSKSEGRAVQRRNARGQGRAGAHSSVAWTATFETARLCAIMCMLMAGGCDSGELALVLRAACHRVSGCHAPARPFSSKLGTRNWSPQALLPPPRNVR